MGRRDSHRSYGGARDGTCDTVHRIAVRHSLARTNFSSLTSSVFAAYKNEVVCGHSKPHRHVHATRQSHACRLSAFKLVVQEWRGPVSVAVYIEFPAGSLEAARCRAHVTDYIRSAVLDSWTVTPTKPPMVVSLLYARQASPEASCDIPGAPMPNATAVAGAGAAVNLVAGDAGMATGGPEAVVLGGGGGVQAGAAQVGAAQVGAQTHAQGQASDTHAAADARQRRFGQPRVPQYMLNRFQQQGARRLAGDARPADESPGHQRTADRTARASLLSGEAHDASAAWLDTPADVAAGGARALRLDVAADGSGVPGLKPVWRLYPRTKGALPWRHRRTLARRLRHVLSRQRAPQPRPRASAQRAVCLPQRHRLYTHPHAAPRPGRTASGLRS